MVVVDAGGHTAGDTTTDDAGHYRCTLAAGTQAPFAIAASTADQTLYSGAPAALSGTVNVTPLTTLIIARLTPSGDPARFAAAIQADPGVASAANVAARVAEVRALVAPLGAAAGAVVDPLNGMFPAAGTGHDKVLDALQITIRPEGSVSNSEVAMKVAPASNDALPLSVTFKSNETTPPPPVTTIAPEALAGSGVATQVADLLERMHRCYALPLAERIAGVTAASGDAGAVQAPACRRLFVGDDSARYLDNGLHVGSGQATPELNAQWLARTDVQSGQGLTFGTPSATAPSVVRVGPEGDLPGWTLPDGAAPVTVVNVFGQFAGNSRFNDSAKVASTDRRTTVQCSRQSNADLHCDSSAGALQFAAGGHVYTVELWGRTLRQVERVKHMALWRLPE